ncbi:MAG: FecR domain-containing protein [Verrucomicrobiota bacterium]
MFVFAFGHPAFSAEKTVIGTFSRIKGDVAVLSGLKLTTLKKAGADVYEGDRVQTKNGEADIELNDGAIIKISPYTSGMIQERKEKAGKFTLKTIPVRRVTCSVGKMWIKSGKNSKVKNFIQTPTSVCALRGTEVAFGYVPKAAEKE